MRERPILFSGPMVRAILDGTKTQTRRVVKHDFMHQPDGARDAKWYIRARRDGIWDSYETQADLVARHCPYGAPGDRLWVREAWGLASYTDTTEWHRGSVRGADDRILCHWTPQYRADYEVEDGCHWRPSIHLPRWASRITLEVTSVRVERLQDISEEDIIAEGAAPERWLRAARTAPDDDRTMTDGIRAIWEMLWIDINGRESWDANPWVWAVSFERVTP